MSIELPHPPAAFDVVYEFPSPLGGVHRKLDSNRWNGNRPTTSQPVYSQDQLREYAQEASRLALEAAAKDVLRYRNGNTALLEALMDMVLQHCCGEPDDIIRHGHLSANEVAVELLEQAGMIKEDGLHLDWPALQARKDAIRALAAPGAGKEGGW